MKLSLLSHNSLTQCHIVRPIKNICIKSSFYSISQSPVPGFKNVEVLNNGGGGGGGRGEQGSVKKHIVVTFISGC